MGRAENPIQGYILDRLMLLERQGFVYYFRNNSFTGRVMRYNGTQGFIKNSKRGMPDIILCVQGTFVGIECKAKGSYQTPEQREAQKMIEKVGGKYWLIRTPEEFEERLLPCLMNRTEWVEPSG